MLKYIVSIFLVLLIGCTRFDEHEIKNMEIDYVRKELMAELIESFNEEEFVKIFKLVIDDKELNESEILITDLFNRNPSNLPSIYTYFSIRGKSHLYYRVLLYDPNLVIYFVSTKIDKITKESLSAINTGCVISEKFNEDSDYLEGYRRGVGYINLSTSEEPEDPLLILNESVEYIANTKDCIEKRDMIINEINYIKSPSYTFGNLEYYRTDDLYSDKDYILVTREKSIDCERDIELKEEGVKSIKWTSCSSYMLKCGWWEKYAKLRAYIIYGKYENNKWNTRIKIINFKPEKHGKYILNGLFGCRETKTLNNPDEINNGLFLWNKEYIGTPIKYIWFEVDGSKLNSNIIVNMSINSALDISNGFNVKEEIYVNSKDDFLGESIIEYCDNMGINENSRLYNTGSIIFGLGYK